MIYNAFLTKTCKWNSIGIAIKLTSNWLLRRIDTGQVQLSNLNKKHGRPKFSTNNLNKCYACSSSPQFAPTPQNGQTHSNNSSAVADGHFGGLALKGLNKRNSYYQVPELIFDSWHNFFEAFISADLLISECFSTLV